jgi:hypothetical protein
MATTTKVLARTAASTSNTTLYTAPTTSTTVVISNIAVANTAASSGTFTLNIDGVAIFSSASIAANTTAIIDLKQVLPANNPAKTISGSASATTINFHISGVEIS